VRHQKEAKVKEFLKKIFGTRNERNLKRMRPLVARINEIEPEMARKSDEELKALTPLFRKRLTAGETLDDILPEVFAAVREASRRTVGMRHFDVQLIGGIALHRGMIAEMKTGEGKTLVATLALALNALRPDPKNPERGMGAHLVTVNDYLAQRDAEWMGPIYRALGLSVGVIVHGLSDKERQEAYNCDITYGTNNEFGFDYLRDNMKFSLADMVHRYYDFGTIEGQRKTFHYAIVDEVDSILIDEARTPLIISGPAEESSDVYYTVNAIIPMLRRDEDFVVDEKANSVMLTERGIEKVEKRLGLRNLYDPENVEILHRVNQALRAHNLFKRDVNYVVEDGKVIIVDEFTGRKMPGRRWSDGLHQAIEAKEGLKIEEENQTLATITFQNYFRLYHKLAGMTGTADTEAEEFDRIYKLEVLIVPTHKLMIRRDEEDVVFKTERAKFMAVVQDIKDCYSRGQPVLVGTTSVDKSELLSRLLKKEGIVHSVLNAKNHALEAEIIAQAGRKGAVTLSTNMAGRGTDIVLGGNPEGLAKVGAGGDKEKFKELLGKFKVQCEQERKEVIGAGGLRVVGTERHESRRIDNQLRGRSGRQGDPGSSRFYLSLEDDLMRVFGGDTLKNIMDKLNVPDDEPIVHRWVTKSIEGAQKRVEAHNFDIRKNLLEYDNVMNQQRQTIYDLRRRILEGVEVHKMILNAIEQVALMYLDRYCPESANPEEWDYEGLVGEVQRNLGLRLDTTQIKGDPDRVAQKLVAILQDAYEQKGQAIANKLLDMRLPRPVDEAQEAFDREQWLKDRERLSEEILKSWSSYEAERYLATIDALWKNHLYAMDHLREGIYLEAYAQKDPKILYKKEGFELFKQLLDLINEQIVTSLFRVEVREESDMVIQRRRRQVAMVYGRGVLPQQMTKVEGQQGQSSGPGRTGFEKVGRNDPCPCGSGKKYKKCCMPKHQAAGQI
jgi:preprotein translocase subunit SecA